MTLPVIVGYCLVHHLPLVQCNGCRRCLRRRLPMTIADDPPERSAGQAVVGSAQSLGWPVFRLVPPTMLVDDTVATPLAKFSILPLQTTSWPHVGRQLLCAHVGGQLLCAQRWAPAVVRPTLGASCCAPNMTFPKSHQSFGCSVALLLSGRFWHHVGRQLL